MSRPTAAAILARRDQIMAALRGPVPLTMNEILTRLKAHPSAYSWVYADLRAMAQQGLVEWLDWSHAANPYRGQYASFRVAAHPEQDQVDRDALAELEERWQAPAGGDER